jgi:hypothetical protein
MQTVRIRGTRGIALIGLLALTSFSCGGGDASATNDPAGGGAGGAHASASGAGTDDVAPIGDPRAPLPEPVAVPANGGPELAAMLAEQVRGGGEEGAAALLTAFRLSGIGVRGPNGELAVDPVRPAQGTVIEAWEIRPLVALAREQRTMLIPLEELALLIRETAPELAKAPIEQLLLDGLRQHATSSGSPLAVWASFVSALGSTHPDLGEPDLLTAGEPRDVVVNGLQASLLLRRLGTDLLVLANPPSARTSFLAPLKWLSPKPLHAAQSARPCTLTPEAQLIMDVAAFGAGVAVGGAQVGDLGFPGLVGILKDAGVPGAEGVDRFTKVAGVVLAYAQFLQTYSMLEATLDMDQPPLPRTRETRPRTGERRNIVATIRLSSGDAQALNCYRILLNSVGLDYTLPQDGAAKGAQVAWTGIHGFNQAAEALHGGPEAIVQFVDDPANRIQDGSAWRFTSSNAVVNQTADENGVVRVTVEGRGQRKPVPRDAGRVVKQATVGLQVALKGADLFGDMKDAASTAMGGATGLLTMPLELLYRMKWASAGRLTFPVLDWGEGNGWSGTLDVSIRASGGGSKQPLDHMKYTASRFTTLHFDFTNGVGTWTGRQTVMRKGWLALPDMPGCAQGPRQTQARLSGQGPAWLEVGEERPPEARVPRDDENTRVASVGFGYSPERTALGISAINFAGREVGTEVTCGPNLQRVIVPVNVESSLSYYPLGSTYGHLPDPMKADALSGSYSGPFEDEDLGIKGYITMQWELSRTR